MPASTQKDRFRAIATHKVPPHLSKEKFEGKVEALVDDVVALLSAQRHLLKLELLFWNKSVEDALQSLGFPPAEPHVITVAESETLEHLAELLRDEEVQRLAENAKDLLNGASAWAADVQFRTVDASSFASSLRFTRPYSSSPLPISATNFSPIGSTSGSPYPR
ncbi:hypothetical protein B0H16DRAFT_1506041 [Mycena metata]|uniref:Uncharacterized protein n=1 Tax=Mycena metata TaxID=1033252 RepID=A0AAD7NV79_9AGAR|nr:hypothetical protein B0H16DRAFT_1506041 [Mycena metata]